MSYPYTYWTCNTCGSFWRANAPPENSICFGCKQSSTFEGSKFIEDLKQRQIRIMKLVDGFFRQEDYNAAISVFNEKKLANVFQCDVSFIPTPPPEGATYEEKMAMRVEYHITITYYNDQCLDVGAKVKQISIDFLPEGAPKISDLTQSDSVELGKSVVSSKSTPALKSTPAPSKSGVKPTKKSEKKPDIIRRR